MRRSYLLEYTVLLVICFFSVRTCMSEKQANSDLKTENTAISDSSYMYKQKYGREHAAKEALLESIPPVAKHHTDSFAHILNLFCRQVKNLPAPGNNMLYLAADTIDAEHKQVVRFRCDSKWGSVNGMLIFTRPEVYSPDSLPAMSGNMITAPGCTSCHHTLPGQGLRVCTR